MHKSVSLRSSNLVLDSLVSFHALERHMAIKNGGNQGGMHVNTTSKMVCLDECRNNGEHLHRDNTQQDGDTEFKKLPRTLLLQLDNCGSENKNCYVFAYLSLLVAKGVFDIVKLGFLMVGHTHEDIDALFSRFSEEIRTEQVFSFPHLMQQFNDCM